MTKKAMQKRFNRSIGQKDRHIRELKRENDRLSRAIPRFPRLPADT